MTTIHVHRGAGELAIENSLAAYEAALLAGADGLEVDIRRCADGNLVMFHDEWVDRRLEAFGQLGEYSYPELLLCRYRRPFGLTRKDERVATFDEFLALAKRYRPELHIDLKAPDGDASVLEKIRQAGLLDRVVKVNKGSAPMLYSETEARHHNGPSAALIWGANDFDGATVADALARAENGLLLLDDPRCALAAQKRLKPDPYRLAFQPPRPEFDLWPGEKRLPLDRAELAKQIWSHPANLLERLIAERGDFAQLPEYLLWALSRLAERGIRLPEIAAQLALTSLRHSDQPEVFEAAADLAGQLKLSAAVDVLCQLLHGVSPVAEFTDDPFATREIRKTIRFRAAASRALGQIGDSSPESLKALRNAAIQRSLSLENGYQGLDGSEAVKALARLDPDGNLDLFRDIVLRSDPALEPVRNNDRLISWLRKHPDWWDFRLRVEAIRAVGDSTSPKAVPWLFGLLATDSKAGEKLWDEFHWEVARGITSGARKLNAGQIRALFAHNDPSVQREGANYLLRSRQNERRELMRQFLPWFPASEE